MPSDALPKRRRREEIMEMFERQQTPVLTTGDIVSEFDVSRTTINSDMSALLDEHGSLEVHNGKGTNVYYLDDAVGPFAEIEGVLRDIWTWSRVGQMYVASVIGLGMTVLVMLLVAINVSQGSLGLAENNITAAATFGAPSLVGWVLSTLILRKRNDSDSWQPWDW